MYIKEKWAEVMRFVTSARQSVVIGLRQPRLEEPPGEEHEDETLDDQGADFGGDVLEWNRRSAKFLPCKRPSAERSPKMMTRFILRNCFI